MPCIHWFDPSQPEQEYILVRCVEIIEKVREIEDAGKSEWGTLKDVKMLLDHLYNPRICEEKE